MALRVENNPDSASNPRPQNQFQPGKKYLGTVVKHLEREMIVQIGQGRVRVPDDASLRLGAQVQLTVDQNGTIFVKSIELLAAEMQADATQDLLNLLGKSQEKRDSSGVYSRPASSTKEAAAASSLPAPVADELAIASQALVAPEPEIVVGRVLSVLVPPDPSGSSASGPAVAASSRAGSITPQAVSISARAVVDTVDGWMEIVPPPGLKAGDIVQIAGGGVKVWDPKSPATSLPEAWLGGSRTAGSIGTPALAQPLAGIAGSATLPAILSVAGEAFHPAFAVSYEMLKPWREDPAFARAVIDFGRMLRWSGLFDAPDAKADEALSARLVVPSTQLQESSTPGRQPAAEPSIAGVLPLPPVAPGVIPAQSSLPAGLAARPDVARDPAAGISWTRNTVQLELPQVSPETENRLPERNSFEAKVKALFELFLSNPVSPGHEEEQARTWAGVTGDPVRPFRFLEWLDPLSLPRPDASGKSHDNRMDAVRLEADTPLVIREPALAALEKKLGHPPNLTDVVQWLGQQDAAGKLDEQQRLQKHVLQALLPELQKRDADSPAQTQSAPVFLWQEGARWQGVELKRRLKRGGRRPGEAGVNLRIETRTEQLGRVQLGVGIDGQGAEIDLRNERRDVRALLEGELEEMRGRLAELGFPLKGWKYSRLPEARPRSGREPSPEPGSGIAPAGPLLDIKV